MNTTIQDVPQIDFAALEMASIGQSLNKIQRTPEWYAARRGRFTGSEIWKLLTEPRTNAAKANGELSETAKTYINQVLAELVTGITPEPFSHAMQWGCDHEDEAIAIYKELFFEQIEPCDFIPYHEFGGGSPDGFIGDKGIAEIKCPFNSGNHIENLELADQMAKEADGNKAMLLFKDYHKEYYWQIQNNLMVTDREFCRFISYDPRFLGNSRIACITIGRVESDIEQIRKKITVASTVMTSLKIRLGL